MHPRDQVAGRERPHARGVPGEAGIGQEAAPLAARAGLKNAAGSIQCSGPPPGTVVPALRASTRTSPPGPGGAIGARRRRCRGARPSAASAPPGRPLGRRSANTRRRDRRRRPGTSAGALQCAAATTRPASTASRRRPTARSGPARRRGAAAVAAMARAAEPATPGLNGAASAGRGLCLLIVLPNPAQQTPGSRPARPDRGTCPRADAAKIFKKLAPEHDRCALTASGADNLLRRVSAPIILSTNKHP